MGRDVSTFLAKCSACGNEFEYPLLGDFSYGENIFSTEDGNKHVFINAFDPFPQRISALMKDKTAKLFWPVLAHFADPINGSRLVPNRVCSHCRSEDIKIYDGRRLGALFLADASFNGISLFSDNEILQKIDDCINNHKVNR